MDQTARAFPTLTRIELAREADFMLGALRIRPSRREVEAAGARHVLQRRVMQVLVALAHPNAEVVSHDELIRRCWGGLTVGEDAIGRCIGQLRRLAARWAEPPFEIQTIAGVGYRLDAPAGGCPEAESPADETRLPRWRGRRIWGAIAAGALVLAALATWATLSHPFGSTSPPARVAVLPLETLSAGQNVRYLADSISDEVLGVLSANQVEALSRVDAVGLRGPSPDQDAARLGVGFLVNGSVQDDGKETRVSIRLDDPRTHVTLWSTDFRRDSASAGDLRIEVAAKVADIIEIAQFARTNPPTLRDDTALSAVLEEHDLIRAHRRASWARQMELARRVVAAAPDFAFGHSLLAVTSAQAIDWNILPQQKVAMAATARWEASRALAIDSRDAGAYFAMSLLEPSYRGREGVLLRGLRANGRPAAPLGALNSTEGSVLLAVGRIQDALRFKQRSVALDPLSPGKTGSLIWAYELVEQR
ncbi:MAG: winged helix-turn-helix domain-containing protein, partial [Caulobacterales bacterium]